MTNKDYIKAVMLNLFQHPTANGEILKRVQDDAGLLKLVRQPAD